MTTATSGHDADAMDLMDKDNSHHKDHSDKDQGSTSDTDSDSVTSDEEEYLDDNECERLKSEKSAEMSDLEKQFAALKEQLYYERLNRVEVTLAEVRAGRSLDYLQPLEELQNCLRIRTDVASVMKSYKMSNVRDQYDAEKVAALQHKESECQAIIDSIRLDLDEKLRRLEDDKNSIDTELGDLSSPQKKKRYRNHGASGIVDVGPMGRDQLNLPDRRKRPVPVAGPYVVYMLREQDILDDYAVIRKAARSPGSYYYF